MTRILSSAMSIIPILSLFSGCGSVTETQETNASPPQPIVKHTPPRMEFETKTDTIASQKARPESIPALVGNKAKIKYMVQIGAFKDPHYASVVQAAARARYRMPVLNDYNTTYSMYQIRIGFFATREDAYGFRARMKREHPKEYKDAWVVQLKR